MIKIYTLEGCEDCKRIKELLDGNNLEYEEIDLGKPGNIEIKRRMKAEGIDRVPIVDIDGKIYTDAKEIINDREERR